MSHSRSDEESQGGNKDQIGIKLKIRILAVFHILLVSECPKGHEVLISCSSFATIISVSN